MTEDDERRKMKTRELTHAIYDRIMATFKQSSRQARAYFQQSIREERLELIDLFIKLFEEEFDEGIYEDIEVELTDE